MILVSMEAMDASK